MSGAWREVFIGLAAGAAALLSLAVLVFGLISLGRKDAMARAIEPLLRDRRRLLAVALNGGLSVERIVSIRDVTAQILERLVGNQRHFAELELGLVEQALECFHRGKIDDAREKLLHIGTRTVFPTAFPDER